MAKKTYQQVESDRIEITIFLSEIVILTATYKKFYKTALPRHYAALQAEQYSDIPKQVKEYSPQEMENIDDVLRYRLMIDFVSTSKGQNIYKKLRKHFGLPDIPEDEEQSLKPVRVIPHKKAILRLKGDPKKQVKVLDISPHLEDRRYLNVSIDLMSPKEHIRREIDMMLDRYKHYVTPACSTRKPKEIPEERELTPKEKLRKLRENKIRAYTYFYDGETIMKIARSIFPDIGLDNPSYSEAANKARVAVTDWIDEISQIIICLELI